MSVDQCASNADSLYNIDLYIKQKITIHLFSGGVLKRVCHTVFLFCTPSATFSKSWWFIDLIKNSFGNFIQKVLQFISRSTSWFDKGTAETRGIKTLWKQHRQSHLLKTEHWLRWDSPPCLDQCRLTFDINPAPYHACCTGCRIRPLENGWKTRCSLRAVLPVKSEKQHLTKKQYLLNQRGSQGTRISLCVSVDCNL